MKTGRAGRRPADDTREGSPGTLSRKGPRPFDILAGSRTGEGLTRLIARLVKEELEWRERKGLDRSLLRSYYSRFFAKDGSVLWPGVAGYVRRLAPVFDFLGDSPRPLRVLDAGCGYGTESLLFALLGHNVIGIELVAERTALAESRTGFYRSIAAAALNVRFFNSNIMAFLGRNKELFDIIWAMEAVSHIHPVEPFLKAARMNLAPNGRLIISDPNLLNPLAWWRSVRIRGSLRHRPHLKFSDPDSGLPVEYGQEKILNPFLLKTKLSKFGYRTLSIHMSGFMGTSFLPEHLLKKRAAAVAMAAFQNALQKAPVLRFAGTIYTLTAANAD